MSKEMRNIINDFNEKLVTESSLNRITKHLTEHNCAVISASRNKMINCTPKSYKFIKSLTNPNINPNTMIDDLTDKKVDNNENMERHRVLRAYLLKKRYGVTDVIGSYIENYMEENAVEVLENSLFVVNSNDDPDFFNEITKLGEMFCQDSVLFLTNGGQDNWLFGTNYHTFPGYHQKDVLKKYRPGIKGEFMTKIKNRPFTTETYEDLQVNSRMMVEKYASKIKDFI